MRQPVFALAATIALAGCSGDESFTNAPDAPPPLAVVDAGLDPPQPDPLAAPTAWVLTTGADAARAVTTTVPARRMDDEDLSAFWAASDTVDLEAVGVEDGVTRWEGTLARRGSDRGRLYWIEALSTDAVVARPPERDADPARIEAVAFELAGERPAWPALRTARDCTGDRTRVFDGAEDEATLAPGVPFDVIRDARFVPWQQAVGMLANPDRVTRGYGVEIDGQPVFFPLIAMLFHEVSNQRLGDRWTVMTYCPLTDSGLLFDTGFDPDALPRRHDFAPSGLFNSNLMVSILERPVERRTLISQMLGYGVRGPEADECVDALPSLLVEFDVWRAMHPETLVLSGDPALADRYDYRNRSNPYAQYWNSTFEIRGEVARRDDRLPIKQPVMGVLDDEDPLAVVLGPDDFVHTDRVGDVPVAVLHARRTAIVLERVHPITGEEIVLRRTDGTWGGMPLYEDDSAAPSVWSFEGIALRGPAAGARLAWVPSMSAFWFAWYAIHPSSRVVEGGSGVPPGN